MGGSGLDRTDDFQKFCGSGLDRIQFHRIKTGLGMKNFTVRSSLLECSRGGTGSGVTDSTPAGFCVFLLDPDTDPESIICEKLIADPKPLFKFGSSWSLCGHFLRKTNVNYSWIDDCSRSLNKSRILK